MFNVESKLGFAAGGGEIICLAANSEIAPLSRDEIAAARRNEIVPIGHNEIHAGA